jgi:dTDP-4-dehydrorhamnose 3,5-epimerase
MFSIGTIEGVRVKPLVKYADKRGWLAELFREDEIPGEFMPVMGYVSSTEPGIARGPHEHRDQADCFCFIGPSTFRVYMWDNRQTSSTYRMKMVVEAGEERPMFLIIPAGVVHAYRNIGSVAGWVVNLPNRLYAGKGRKEPVDEIRHEEAEGTEYVLD